ncbi:hypothetical protein R1sor_004860 [Riccia sorocarpa]|uniref:F-box associated domain-containing protein n=1 Tax=Riccia sorocarpa TaxID=122646 RepID=A0ABD3HLT2_9MARC
MLLPNLKTNSWDKHSLDFLGADEWILGYHVAVDGGLVCYEILKKSGVDPWFTLVVQNPLTRKWRRLTVPYQLEGDFDHTMIWGLMMDRENGSYKVVVALFGQYLPRTAFIYDSVSKSWSISAALTPVLDPHFDEDGGWEVRSVVCSRDELLWVIEDQNTYGLTYKWFIKYNFELETWSSVTHESPLLDEKAVDLVHDDVENRKFGIEDVKCLVNEAGDAEWLDSLNPEQVVFGGGTWYIVSDQTFYRNGLDVFAVSVNPPTVTRLPKIYDQEVGRPGVFAATLRRLCEEIGFLDTKGSPTCRSHRAFPFTGREVSAWRELGTV